MLRRRAPSARLGSVLLLLGWLLAGAACAGVEVHNIEAPPMSLMAETPLPPGTAVLSEQREIEMEWPAVMHVGDGDVVRLAITLAANNTITPTAVVEGNVIQGDPIEIPDLYDSHNLVATARLDMAGLQVLPQGDISLPMVRGQTVTFLWSLNAPEEGRYKGTLWLYLTLVPKLGGVSEQRLLLARPMDIEARSFLGIPVITARWFGLIGAVIGAVLGLPFINQLGLWLWGRIRPKRRLAVRGR